MLAQRKYSAIELRKERVGTLKRIIADYNERCDGCSEKSELVRKVLQLQQLQKSNKTCA